MATCARNAPCTARGWGSKVTRTSARTRIATVKKRFVLFFFFLSLLPAQLCSEDVYIRQLVNLHVNKHLFTYNLFFEIRALARKFNFKQYDMLELTKSWLIARLYQLCVLSFIKLQCCLQNGNISFSGIRKTLKLEKVCYVKTKKGTNLCDGKIRDEIYCT